MLALVINIDCSDKMIKGKNKGSCDDNTQSNKAKPISIFQQVSTQVCPKHQYKQTGQKWRGAFILPQKAHLRLRPACIPKFGQNFPPAQQYMAGKKAICLWTAGKTLARI